jgi:hypothetical protein
MLLFLDPPAGKKKKKIGPYFRHHRGPCYIPSLKYIVHLFRGRQIANSVEHAVEQSTHPLNNRDQTRVWRWVAATRDAQREAPNQKKTRWKSAQQTPHFLKERKKLRQPHHRQQPPRSTSHPVILRSSFQKKKNINRISRQTSTTAGSRTSNRASLLY